MSHIIIIKLAEQHDLRNMFPSFVPSVGATIASVYAGDEVSSLFSFPVVSLTPDGTLNKST